MLITILDDSVPFDGDSPTTQPLGGPEKAVVGLAAALARRGHVVRVFNRCARAVVVDGVSWQPLDDCKAAHSDWLIAHRKPLLLSLVPEADRRALWVSGPPGYLANGQHYAKLSDYRPVLTFQSLAHTAAVPQALNTFRAQTVVPGVGESYLKAAEMTPAAPPRAVVTTHPAHGLDWLLKLWVDDIFPRVPWAELHIYSASLERGELGGEIAESLRPVLTQAMAARKQSVHFRQPLPDPEMAEVYRFARVHLYPGHDRDMLCTTLAESQAVGLPAVARARGAVKERIINGQTGFLAPDDEAFVNLAVRLLDDQPTFDQLSAKARDLQRSRGWDRVAQDFEGFLA